MTAYAMTVRAILFDLDGTLVNTSPDIASAANAALAELGVGPLEVAQIMPHVGNGAYNLLARLTGVRHRGDPRIEAAVQTFISHYRQSGASGSKLYPGMSRVLQSLAGRVPMAVISNKPEALVWTTLDHIRADKYFDLVLGGDTLPKKKPDPMPIRWTLKRMGVEPSEAVMIGDTVTDIQAGRRAGTWTCGVTWGYGDPAAHPEFQPHTMIDSTNAVAQYFMPVAAA